MTGGSGICAPAGGDRRGGQRVAFPSSPAPHLHMQISRPPGRALPGGGHRARAGDLERLCPTLGVPWTEK